MSAWQTLSRFAIDFAQHLYVALLGRYILDMLLSLQNDQLPGHALQVAMLVSILARHYTQIFREALMLSAYMLYPSSELLFWEAPDLEHDLDLCVCLNLCLCIASTALLALQCINSSVSTADVKAPSGVHEGILQHLSKASPLPYRSYNYCACQSQHIMKGYLAQERTFTHDGIPEVDSKPSMN